MPSVDADPAEVAYSPGIGWEGVVVIALFVCGFDLMKYLRAVFAFWHGPGRLPLSEIRMDAGRFALSFVCSSTSAFIPLVETKGFLHLGRQIKRHKEIVAQSNETNGSPRLCLHGDRNV